MNGVSSQKDRFNEAKKTAPFGAAQPSTMKKSFLSF